jgi:hypothetical protein
VEFCPLLTATMAQVRDQLRQAKLLGDKAATMIVSEQAYEFTDATVDSQIVSLKASGADVFFNFGSPKFAAQAIRKAYDIGWRPLEFIAYTATSMATTRTVPGMSSSFTIFRKRKAAVVGA